MGTTIELVRDFILTFGLYMQILACTAYYLITRKTSAFLCCAISFILFTGIQVFLEQQLGSLAQNPRFEQLVYNAWYLGFAYTDAMFVIAVIYICRRKAFEIDNVTRMILISYVVLGSVQVARYFDRIILETNAIGDLYSLVVPTIYISNTLLICSYAIYVFFKRHEAIK